MGRLWKLLGCSLALAFTAICQTDHGIITGTVSDPAKAVVPGAVVVAKNTETGAVSQTVSTQTGNFTAPSLPAGNYEVTVEAPGFRKYIGQGVRVQVAQVIRIDATLEVGATTESITVEAQAAQLKSESVEQSINVSGNRVVMPTPSSGNPLQTPTRNSAGVPTAGFGRIDASTVSGQRNGQIVARVEW